MIGLAIGVQAAELLGWTGLWLKLKRDTSKQILMHGKMQPQKIPFVDRQLLRLAGHPSKVSREASSRLTKLARRAVNTRAFEYIMLGVCNPKSKLHTFLRKPTKIVVL